MKTHMKTLSLSLVSSAILATLSFGAAAGDNNSVSQALADSKVNLSLRARLETVDQDGANGAADIDATALTLQSRLTVQSGFYNGFGLGVEVDNVTALVDDYNDLTLSYSGSDAVVADPEITDVNQAYLQYKTDKLTATAGRQRILHNNQRFVGGVGWRQNEQTYDGYRLQYQATDKFSVDYSYIFNVNRIFAADSKKADDLSGDFHFVNAAYKVDNNHKVSAFAYVLDFDSAAAMSSSTYGALYNGNFDSVFVNASYATQSDNGDNPVSYDASYYNFELGAKLEKFTVLGGYELLGSDNGNAAFSTPFATLHKFQGFADNFLGTGSSTGFKNGVEDLYLTVKTKLSDVGISATFHDLSSDEGSIDYGTEFDIAASYKIAKKYSLLLKYATYSADDLATDTNKLWLQVATKF